MGTSQNHENTNFQNDGNRSTPWMCCHSISTLVICIFMLILFTNCNNSKVNEDTSQTNSKISEDNNAFVLAALNGQLENVKAFIAAGADINAKDAFKQTPLYYAAQKGHIEIVKTLIDAGANVNVKNGADWTPLFKAAMEGHAEVVKALIAAGADINAKDFFKQTPLHYAVQKGHVETVKALIDAGADLNVKDELNNTLLHYATGKGHNEVVKMLIATGADVNAKTNDGDTPLHLAANKSLEVVKTLIAAGADVNAPNKWNEPPIYVSVINNDVEIVKQLVAAGADVNPNLKDDQGLTLLHHAVFHGYPFEVAMILASAGADTNAKDNRGNTAPDYILEPYKSDLQRANKNALRQVQVNDGKVSEYINTVVSFFSDLADIADRAGYDCNKLGADLNAHLNKNRDSLVTGMKKLASLDENSPEAQKLAQSMDKVMDDNSTISKKLDTCKDNPQIMAFSMGLLDVVKVAAPDEDNDPTPSPTPAQNNNEKRCAPQTISKEKHLPMWNIEIIAPSVIASMLKDAEKNHLPFLKINASDNLKQKLETYINKDPSKLNPDFKNAFTCTLGDYIRTSSKIGIQLVYCSDGMSVSVAFLNLVSPVDNKARVYKAETFDHIFEETPTIVKTEETVLNGERGAYVAVKYNTFSDGTGTEHEETDIVHYLFLGDKLRYLTDWNAFHIVENEVYHDDDTEEYSCNAKTTVLRLESSGAKQQEHTFSISTSN